MQQYALPVCYDLKMNRNIFIVIFSLMCLHAVAQSPSDADKIYVAVEKQAVPPKGLQQFYADFAGEFKSPDLPKDIAQVRVMVSFVVEKDGSLTDISVLRDGGFPEVGIEAIRVLKKLSPWNPAWQNGAEVRSQFTLPVTLQVSKKKKFSDYMKQ